MVNVISECQGEHFRVGGINVRVYVCRIVCWLVVWRKDVAIF